MREVQLLHRAQGPHEGQQLALAGGDVVRGQEELAQVRARGSAEEREGADLPDLAVLELDGLERALQRADGGQRLRPLVADAVAREPHALERGPGPGQADDGAHAVVADLVRAEVQDLDGRALVELAADQLRAFRAELAVGEPAELQLRRAPQRLRHGKSAAQVRAGELEPVQRSLRE